MYKMGVIMGFGEAVWSWRERGEEVEERQHTPPLVPLPKSLKPPLLGGWCRRIDVMEAIA